MSLNLTEISRESREAQFGSDIHGIVERLAEKIHLNHPENGGLKNWYQSMDAFVNWCYGFKISIEPFGNVEKAIKGFLNYRAYSYDGDAFENWLSAQKDFARDIYINHCVK
ncbi:MAG: hypothetical protein Q8N99_02570 [Nanoarchaeota archaeon]|nr:hypothetical protein [Nanoarchaeota archaeon]